MHASHIYIESYFKNLILGVRTKFRIQNLYKCSLNSVNVCIQLDIIYLTEILATLYNTLLTFCLQYFQIDEQNNSINSCVPRLKQLHTCSGK